MRKVISCAFIVSFFSIAPLWAHEDGMGMMGMMGMDMKDKDMKDMDMKDKDTKDMYMDHKDSVAKEKTKEESSELTGEFVELGCYVSHDSTGSDHSDCANKCARAGAPIALKEAGSGKLYVVITDDHFVNPAKLAFGKIGVAVKVAGIVKKSGSLDMLILRKVDVLKSNSTQKADK